ncbi:MAG: hypothetical protein M1549_01935 [Candidatus Dependentiae bacterium]|nr:hypothetical protein [Candidatus Dependentiae bacterium]
MNPPTMTARRYELISRLSRLPKQIISVRDADYLAELIFCELCGQNCFNLKKAAYFLDNPDFDCCRGIVGISADEFQSPGEELWADPLSISDRVRRSPFYQKVRALNHASAMKNNSDYVLTEIAKMLGIEHPTFCICDARHENHAILISDERVDDEVSEYLEYGMSILSLCPLV